MANDAARNGGYFLLFGRKTNYYEKINSSLAKLLQAIVGE